MAQIYKRNNSWSYRVTYKDISGKRKSISKSGFKTKKEAANSALEIEQKKKHNADFVRENYTFLEYFKDWLNLYKYGRHAEITEQRYRRIEKVIDQYFHDVKLKDITKSDYQKFINNYTANNGKPLAHETISKTNSYIRACVNSAIDDQIIYSNFTNNIVIDGKKGKKETDKFLNTNDFLNLMKLAEETASFKSISRYLILAGGLTGARYSELLGLTWDDVDLKNNTIDINKTYDYNITHTFKPTKTDSSVRVINISTNLSKCLSSLKSKQLEYQLAHNKRYKDNLVFRNFKGEIPSDSATNKMLKKLQSELSITNPITFHGLRHTHTSYLLSEGVDIFYISKRLGHKNISVTQRTYSHLLDSFKEKEVNKTLKALENI